MTRESNTGAPSVGEVTVLLDKLAAGEQAALDELFPLVYNELRRIARGQRYRNTDSATLDTTGLLHEAYLKFAGKASHAYNHRHHFYAVAATAMRHVLLDEAKRRLRQKRGGQARQVSLDPEQLQADEQAERLLIINDGLERLGRLQPRARKVVEYRFFGGLTESEIAQLLAVDTRTVRRDWAKAKAWLGLALAAD
ncbi:MAG: DNA-directed RNA polymerase sigma-70 factor [Lysobacteraceae bacterium]|nr:MAG: DNA-directed RNA polymerase sigma-70 factor [Xanthomonadaceae bacterium]